MFVNLRRYRGLKSSGYGVIEKAVSYQPFHLTITFRQVKDKNDSKYVVDSHGMFLIIVAVPVHSIYKGKYITFSTFICKQFVYNSIMIVYFISAR